MRNIYRMLEIVVATSGQRMDKVLIEVFDKITERHHDNRLGVEGWKTNSHYVINKKFIFPHGATLGFRGDCVSINTWSGYGETLHDFETALCFITGENRDQIEGIKSLNDLIAGQYYDTHFFKIKAFKKGTIHCEFISDDVWALFNQHIARIKGFELFEKKPQTEYQKRNAGYKTQEKEKAKPTKANVLFEITL